MSFKPAVNHAAGDYPISVTTGDFNGDGKTDLAVADNDWYMLTQQDKVSVLLGNGDETFQDAISYSAGDFPRAVSAGDFNGDGRTDLAVANNCSSSTGPANVSILLGNGDGTFRTAVNYAVGRNPTAVITADFNGDGKPDLAVTNSNSDSVSILLGNGDGTFQIAADYAVGIWPHSLSAGDFNGDGRPDLAVANVDVYHDSIFQDEVSILLGNGDGTFQAATSHLVGDGPFSVITEDFNGDGRIDLAVANGYSNDVSILAGNGDGTFQNAMNYGASTAPVSVTTADFNGDGRPDLAVALGSTGNVSILPGSGDGTFQAAINFSAGTMPYSVTTGDFNGDGRPDLAVANLFGHNVSILINAATLTANRSGAGTGTVTATGINCGTDCSEIYNYDEIIALGAAPTSGSFFAGWSGDDDCSDGAVTMDTDKTCMAVFEPCTYTISPSGVSLSRIGGEGSIDVTTQSGCPWTAISNNSWISIASGNSGTGSGTVTYSVEFNSELGARDGTLTIAGQTFSISESRNITSHNDYFNDANYYDLWDLSSSGEVSVNEGNSLLEVLIPRPLAGCSYADLASREAYDGRNLLVETGVLMKGYGQMLLRLKKDDDNFVQFGVREFGPDGSPDFVIGNSEDGAYSEQTLNILAEYSVRKKYRYKTFAILKTGDQFRAFLNGMDTGGQVTNPLLGDVGLKVKLLNSVCLTEPKGLKTYFDYVIVTEVMDGKVPARVIKLLAPDGGEEIKTGSIYLVLWEGTDGAAFYSIDYSVDNGLKWKPLDSGIESKFYAWRLQKIKPGISYKLRVNAHDNLGNIIDSDESDASFTVSD